MNATHNALVHPLASPILKSILLGLPVAVVAIGAADNVDLPETIQYLVSRLDVTWWFLPRGTPGEGGRAFAHWVLPINAVFYSAAIYLIFLWRAQRSASAMTKAKELARLPLPGRPTPKDSKIPSLAVALNPDKLAHHLTLVPNLQWCGPLRVVQVGVKAHRRSRRCAFEIAVGLNFIGKVYAEDRQDVYEYMEALRRSGFGREAEFSIPQPVAYLPNLRLLLQERVEGLHARDVFLSGDDVQQARAAERCARWLAHFHAVAPWSRRHSDAAKFTHHLEPKYRLIAAEGGSLASKAERVLAGLRSASSGLGEIPACAGHGDFGSTHIILGGQRTTVYDWDAHAVADPARDVARFLVSLSRLALQQRGSVHALGGAAEVFLDTYLALNEPARVMRRLPFYKAGFFLRGASAVVRLKTTQWREFADELLMEGLGCLEETTNNVKRGIPALDRPRQTGV